MGQYELGLALASAWLCLEPGPSGACGRCSSCHGIAVRTHADLCVLMPESLSLQHGWPLDEKLQAELEAGKRKPSNEIKVDAARDAGAVLVVEDSDRAFADGLLGLAADPVRASALGRHARDWAVAHGSWSAIERRVNDVYGQALGVAEPYNESR